MPWARIDEGSTPTTVRYRLMVSLTGLGRGLLSPILLLALAAPGFAQDPVSLQVRTQDGPLDPALEISSEMGFAAVALEEVQRLGWSLSSGDDGTVALWRSGLSKTACFKSYLS